MGPTRSATYVMGMTAIIALVSPIFAQGVWRVSGATHDPRESTGLVLLPDGRVLVAGGHAQTRRNPDGSRWRLIGTAEVYDPKSETWTLTGPLVEPRQGVSDLTVLANGKVLLAGEHDTRRGAELYDPAAGTWSATGPLAVGRGMHTTTLLLDGRVLVAGGIDYGAEGEPIFASAEIYDPALGTWSTTGAMSGPRFKHRAVRLADGKVLVAGGTDIEPSNNHPLASAELYDPTTGTWSATGPLVQAREMPAIRLLHDGRVLIAGGAIGKFGSYEALATAEIYDPAAGVWTATGSMARDRTQFPMVTLADGRALAIGGATVPRHSALLGVEIFDPASGSWSECAPLAVARWNHRALLMPDGSVLVVGGYNVSGQLTQTEVFRLP